MCAAKRYSWNVLHYDLGTHFIGGFPKKVNRAENPSHLIFKIRKYRLGGSFFCFFFTKMKKSLKKSAFDVIKIRD